jgi:hypothetical protein
LTEAYGSRLADNIINYRQQEVLKEVGKRRSTRMKESPTKENTSL